jgi:branched-chain amino acid transport system substrate-binding protein
MRAGVPVVAGAVALGGFAAVASASTAPHKAKPSFEIAYEGPLSGGVAQLGLNMVYGERLAINLANEGKTFGPLPFSLVPGTYNDQGSETVSPTIAAEIVAKHSIVAVVGPAFSGATKAAEPTFHAASLATVSPSATNVLLATHGWNNFFRVVAADNIQGSADASYITGKLKLKKIYVVSDQTTYGAGLAAAFAGSAKHDHATLIGGGPNAVPSTPACGNGGTGDPSQYPGVASTIKAANPQIIFYGGYYCDLGLLLSALHSAGYKGKVMSGDGSDDPHLIAGTSPSSAANGVYLSCACAVLGKTAADKTFAAGFTKLAHFAPGTYSAEAYDSTNIIIEAMVKIFKAYGAKGETRARIVTFLHAVSWVGLTKVVKFEADGNISGTTVYVNQVRSGKIYQIGLA